MCFKCAEDDILNLTEGMARSGVFPQPPQTYLGAFGEGYRVEFTKFNPVEVVTFPDADKMVTALLALPTRLWDGARVIIPRDAEDEFGELN